MVLTFSASHLLGSIVLSKTKVYASVNLQGRLGLTSQKARGQALSLEVEQEVRAARPETTEKVNIGSMLFF
jgi:hypothetical protein